MYIVIGAALLAALLYPPWVVEAPNGAMVWAGYAFLFTGATYNSLVATIDFARLAVELGIIAVFAGAGFMLTKPKE